MTNEEISEKMTRQAAAQSEIVGVLREPRPSPLVEHLAETETDSKRLQIGPHSAEPLNERALEMLQTTHSSQLGKAGRQIKAAVQGVQWHAKIDSTQPTYDAAAPPQRNPDGSYRYAPPPVTPEMREEAQAHERQTRTYLPVDEAQRLTDEKRSVLDRQQTAIASTQKKTKELEVAHVAEEAERDRQLQNNVEKPTADPYSIERDLKNEQRRLVLLQQELPSLHAAWKAAAAELREAKDHARRKQAGEQFTAEMEKLEKVLDPLLVQLAALGDQVRGLARHVSVAPGLHVLVEQMQARARRALEDAGLMEEKRHFGPDGRSHREGVTNQ
jgi:hypothetical protein